MPPDDPHELAAAVEHRDFMPGHEWNCGNELSAATAHHSRKFLKQERVVATAYYCQLGKGNRASRAARPRVSKRNNCAG
jgi:hypothetical protein